MEVCGSFFTDAFRSKSSSGAPAILTGLSLTADRLLSCGLDGYVKLHPFRGFTLDFSACLADAP
ncbi:MAG: hypothetical protein FRX49_05032 [Trebouxia sp. A1-2]|nr:MAG: hypothetical protein FRX49_05032 [Trebouxia sp. A1-2]